MGDPANRWKVSLHGGHSGRFCDHAEGTLREVLEAAVRVGYHIFGVTEHAPRLGERFLYEAEREMGWDVARLEKNFEDYAATVTELAPEFSDRLEVLRGFETEIVPDDGFAEIMRGYRERFKFDYVVGSVHYVREILIDGPPADFERAVETCGGLEALSVEYYHAIARMVDALEPEVVGHLDLIRKNAPSDESVETSRVREAAEEALETIRSRGCILDLNTAGYRKGLGRPYPAPWLLRRAREMSIGVCFGDDSHSPAQVGAGIDEAREYLFLNGISTLTILTRDNGEVIRKTVNL